MWALYRLDVRDDRTPIDLIEALIERLPYEPMSLWRARRLGGPQWLGWGLHAEQLAALADETRLGSKASAVNKRTSLKHTERAPRPVPPRERRVIPSTQDLSGVLAGLM